MAIMTRAEREARYRRRTREPRVNVGELGRIVSVLGGGAMAAAALKQRAPTKLLLMLGAGSLLYRGMTGHCSVNAALGIDTSRHSDHVISAGHGVRIDRSIVIARSPQDLYRMWRNFENLPRIMSHLESVWEMGAGRSHWVARGPLGIRVEWDAMIIADRPGEVISWRSVQGSTVATAGSVQFHRLAGGRTELRLELKYDPPAGRLGAAIARALGDSPEARIDQDLHSFKEFMEASQAVATAQGLR